MLYIFTYRIYFVPWTNITQYVLLLNLRYHKCMKTTCKNIMYYYKNVQRARCGACPKSLIGMHYLIYKSDQSLAKEWVGLLFDQILMQTYT